MCSLIHLHVSVHLTENTAPYVIHTQKAYNLRLIMKSFFSVLSFPSSLFCFSTMQQLWNIPKWHKHLYKKRKKSTSICIFLNFFIYFSDRNWGLLLLLFKMYVFYLQYSYDQNIIFIMDGGGRNWRKAGRAKEERKEWRKGGRKEGGRKREGGIFFHLSIHNY